MIKKAFATGLIILLPITITVCIIVWIFNFLTEPFVKIVEHFVIAYEQAKGVDLGHHELLTTIFSRIIVLITLSLFIFFLGFCGRRFFFHQLISLSHKLFTKIPVVRTIYKIIAETAKAFLAPGQRTFKETVLIPFPHKDTHALGLVTGDAPEKLRKVIEQAKVSVFVPTSPHPISGYILFTSQEQLIEVPLSTEETFGFLISCGSTTPTQVTEQP